jgi:hypothetical protein
MVLEAATALVLLTLLCTGTAIAQSENDVIKAMNGMTAQQLDAVVRGCDADAELTDDKIDDLPINVVLDLLRNCLGASLTNKQVIDLLRRAGPAFPTAGKPGAQ